MIRKSVQRFSLATNAESVCEKIMLNQESKAAMTIQPNLIALLTLAGLSEVSRHSGTV
jgi:hypothetical protein